MNKEKKIEEIETSIAQATDALKRAKVLFDALRHYEKKTINKSFFEKYFTSKDENGNVRKDWKGNIVTDFRFSDKEWKWLKYYKSIHLAGYQKVEVPSANTIDVCACVQVYIGNLDERIARYQKELAEVKSIDEKAIIADIHKVWKKHGKPSIWSKILDTYEVKNPD